MPYAIILGLLLLSLIGNSSTARAQTKLPADAAREDFVELPAYIVKGERVLPDPESWLHVVIPDMEVTIGKRVIMMQGFEVLSRLSAKNTNVFVKELQLRQLASALFWPALGTKIPGDNPLILIDSEDNPWLSSENPMPIEWENIAASARITPPSQSAAMPIHTDMTDNNANDIFQDPAIEAMLPPGQPDESRISTPDDLPLVDGVVNIHTLGAGIYIKVRAGGTLNNSKISEERLAGMTNSKFARLRISRLRPPAPPWLQQGLGWLIESMTVSQSEIALGNKPIRIARGGDHQLAPLKSIIEDFNPRNPGHVHAASAFVQFGLYGEGSRYSPQFIQFASQTSQGPVDESTFTAIFGMSYAKMDRLLVSFTSSTSILRSTGMRGKIPPMPETIISQSTQSDIARIKSGILQSEGKNTQALDELRVAYWRGERDTKLLAALGDLESQFGDSVRAHKILKRVTEKTDAPARALVAYARMLLGEKQEKLSPGQKMPDAEARKLLEICARAARQRPVQEDLCALVADITLSVETPPDSQTAAFLKNALVQFPDNKSIREAAARVKPPAN
ncbi:tetratricopeptide repeat protein [Ereboglobus luteus]|nr:hypothetical protein [Ereboglobus luteus]